MTSKRKRMLAEQRLYTTQEGRIYKPDVYGTLKKVIRQNEQLYADPDNDDEFGDDIPIESDTISTAEYLIKSNPMSNIPVCFVHQIYSILSNNTVADRELQQAIKEGTWRKFHIIGALEDEYLLMKTSSYCNLIHQAKAECQKNEENSDLKAFDIFFDIAVNAEYNEASISKETLASDFHLEDKNISQLVNYGLLLPHMQVGSFWFSIPKQGSFMSNLMNGRLEILRILKRRQSKDIMEKLLEQKKLRKTVFNVDFLLHDLVGSGRVERFKTAMGDLIRLTNKGEKSV